ncbi:MAG: branched-chain amino acid ABC transporter permease [Nakamurella sp.]
MHAVLPKRRGGEARAVGLAGPLIVIVIAIVVIPSIASGATMFLMEQVLIQILFATSTNFLFGRSHMPSFGQAAFFGTGAYTVALWYSYIPVAALLVLAMAFSAVCSAVIAAVSIRTRGIIFANVTLALGQGMYLLAVKTSWVGGENGLPGISAGSLSMHGIWYLTGGVVVAAIAVCWVIYHSPFGITLQALREDPIRLEFLGVRVARYRLAAFTLAGAGAGLAGGLFAYTSGIVTPGTMYWTQSGYPILMILVGGMGFFWGPVVGAVFVTLLLNELSGHPGWDLIILGLVLIGVLLFAPRGLLGLVKSGWQRFAGSAERRDPVPEGIAP